MKIYTRTGDRGTTCLATGERVEKYDVRVEAYGCVDELMAHIAMLHDMMADDSRLDEYRKELMKINHKLMTISAGFASADHSIDLKQGAVEELETTIDAISSGLRPIDKFTLPGGNELVSMTHICRTVCRRAERAACLAAARHHMPQLSRVYVNRLSDYLYLLGRKLTDILNVKETYWVLEK